MTVQDANSGKPFTLCFEERPEYLYAFVKGEKDSYEISRQYWNEVADECRRVKCGKVIIEEDIKEQMSTTETYRLSSEILSFGFSGIRVAFVDGHLSQQESNEFAELVATNRGMFVKVFNNVEDAEKWLLSK